MYFAEIETGKASRPEVTKSITGTEIDIVAQLTGMDLPGFLNSDFARNKGFRDRVTPGIHLMGSVMGLLAKHGFPADAIWVSATDISFKTSVYPGDRISAEAEV